MKLYSQSKRDANHIELSNIFRQIGASVIDLSSCGGECPDIAIGWRGNTMLAEIKSKKGTLTPAQCRLLQSWKGSKIYIIRTREDCFNMLGVI